jgi:hypothetical protein
VVRQKETLRARDRRPGSAAHCGVFYSHLTSTSGACAGYDGAKRRKGGCEVKINRKQSTAFNVARDCTWRKLHEWLRGKGVRQTKAIHALHKESGLLITYRVQGREGVAFSTFCRAEKMAQKWPRQIYRGFLKSHISLVEMAARVGIEPMTK